MEDIVKNEFHRPTHNNNKKLTKLLTESCYEAFVGVDSEPFNDYDFSALNAGLF